MNLRILLAGLLIFSIFSLTEAHSLIIDSNGTSGGSVDAGAPDSPPTGEASSSEAVASSAGSRPAKVEATNLPIQIMTKIIDGEPKKIPFVRTVNTDYFIQDVTQDLTLKPGEKFQSELLDVRDYKEVTFYVSMEEVIGSSIKPVYQLDAFFALSPEMIKVRKMGEPSEEGFARGWQEFGAMNVDDLQGKEIGAFNKLTTGVTSTRALHTKIYGPFVYVTLKNLSQDSKHRFKVTAYLSR